MASTVESAAASSRLALWKWDVEEAAVNPVDVSLVIVTWNSARWIERCLASIPQAAGSSSFEIIIHDNASDDGTAEAVQAFRGAPVAFRRGSENSGFAGGVNAGVARARGRYIFLLNPDCELEPGSLQVLIADLESHPESAAAVPLLMGEDGQPQRDFQLRRLPTLGTFVSEILFADKLWPGNRLSARYRYRDSSIGEIETVEQPAAAAVLFRRGVFERLGGFDERFAPAWFEDVDYCRRLAAAGLTIRLAARARATHHGGASLYHLDLQQFLRAWYRNLFRYAEKWFRPMEVEVLRWVIVGGMLLRCAASLAGFRSGKMMDSYRAYSEVARDAFHRWNPPFRSS